MLQQRRLSAPSLHMSRLDSRKPIRKQSSSGEDAIRWAAVEAAQVRRFDHLDLHGPHDLRHTFATWLEDAGIPGRVIDELMGHDNAHRARLDRVSRIGMGYRDTTPEVLMRAVAAIESRLAVVLEVAERETRQTTGSGTP